MKARHDPQPHDSFLDVQPRWHFSAAALLTSQLTSSNRLAYQLNVVINGNMRAKRLKILIHIIRNDSAFIRCRIECLYSKKFHV